MTRILLGVAAALLALLLGGCPYSDGGDTVGGLAPRITASFPEPGEQVLVEDGSLTFSAEGEDADSLELDWAWLLDDEVEVFGSSDDGSFDVEWTLFWDQELSGADLDITFEVTDGSYSTDLFWPVDAL
jgi:hypothetical protein